MDTIHTNSDCFNCNNLNIDLVLRQYFDQVLHNLVRGIFYLYSFEIIFLHNSCKQYMRVGLEQHLRFITVYTTVSGYRHEGTHYILCHSFCRDINILMIHTVCFAIKQV